MSIEIELRDLKSIIVTCDAEPDERIVFDSTGTVYLHGRRWDDEKGEYQKALVGSIHSRDGDKPLGEQYRKLGAALIELANQMDAKGGR